VNAEIKQSGGVSAEQASDRHQAEPESGTVPKAAVGVVPAAKRGAIYTMTALEGLDAAELVNAAFARRTIGKQTPRKVEVIAPDGPSTAGGKRARQAIRLVPAAGDGSPIMCGFLDVAQKVVELRSYETLSQQYEARFSERCDITQDEYAGLCRDLQMTLSPFRYSFSFESETHAAAAPRAVAKLTESNRASETNARARVLTVTLVAVLMLALAGVTLMLLR
jgi:hypothetical protein